MVCKNQILIIKIEERPRYSNRLTIQDNYLMLSLVPRLSAAESLGTRLANAKNNCSLVCNNRIMAVLCVKAHLMKAQLELKYTEIKQF